VNQMRYLLATMLFALIALLSAHPFSARAAATIYASDAYSRTLSDSWGTADIGGSYTLDGTTSKFKVNGAVGKMKTAANATNSAYLNSVSAQDIKAKFSFSTNKLAEGGAQNVYLVARRNGGNDYLVRVRILTDNTVYLQAFTEVNGTVTPLGSKVQVPNLTHLAQAFIRVHAQVLGTNPTTINVRAWPDGSPQPSNWQYTVSDSTGGLQTAGAVGLRSYLNSSATNSPVSFSFDNLKVTAATVQPTPTPSPTPGNANLYWGALVDGQAPSDANMQPGGVFDTFEQHAGKKMSIIHWGQPWKMNGTMQAFYQPWFHNVRKHGSIPMIDWASWELDQGANQPAFQNADIYNGAYDSYITQWATAAKNWGNPFFLRYDWEMNGWWFPWGEGNTGSGIVNGNQPGDYVKAWKHVHDIFTSVGATNVTWIWCPNIMSTSTNYPPLSQVYPSDAEVDWTCLDGYNQYDTWLTFFPLFTGSGVNWLQNSYQNILDVAPAKPMMIGETASLEAGDGGAQKAAWMTDMLTVQLRLNFPKIKALVYYNWDNGIPSDTYPIETTLLSQNAFAAGIALPDYAANNYSNLGMSPIPAP
jgi:mannan endo-1,4-beta-mannosidase